MPEIVRTTGPVILTTAGDYYSKGCRILAFLWEGSTSVGNTATVYDYGNGAVLWPARTNDTNTYLGLNLGPTGLPAPNGFRLGDIGAGRVCVYLKEE